MKLNTETPSAMLQEAFHIPYDAYQLDLWQHLILGVLIGAGLAFMVAFALLAAHQVQQ